MPCLCVQQGWLCASGRRQPAVANAALSYSSLPLIYARLACLDTHVSSVQQLQGVMPCFHGITPKTQLLIQLLMKSGRMTTSRSGTHKAGQSCFVCRRLPLSSTPRMPCPCSRKPSRSGSESQRGITTMLSSTTSPRWALQLPP